MITSSDQAERSAIVERLHENMVVEAGAGTGKTTSLVERIVALVTTGRANIDSIAAITFTEAAAAELRSRIGEELEKASADPCREPAERERCRRAVDHLDQTAIQTLHSFAVSLLRERPIEASLPPGFNTRDEIEADIAFEEKWSEWLDATVDDPEAQEVLRPALVEGMTLKDLRDIADKFRVNYDLLPDKPFPMPQMRQSRGPVSLVNAKDRLRRLSSFALRADALLAHVEGVLDLTDQIESVGENTPEAWRLLAQNPGIKQTRGKKSDWGNDDSGCNACSVIKELLRVVDDEVKEGLEDKRAAVLVSVIELLRRFVLGYADERKADGEVEFQDMLVIARDLLRDSIPTRDHLRRRYSHILIDEVQDTDPLQAEIAMFLAEDVPVGAESSDRPKDWRNVRPEAGKLFIVGDPKQSIYRFRRADIQQVKRFRKRIAEEQVYLTQNFRSLPPVIDWVNHLFAQWMGEGEVQPKYIPLEADPRHGESPPVRYIGGELDGAIGDVRRQEAESVVRAIRMAIEEGWPVRSEGDGQETRPAKYQDVCVLMPKRLGSDELQFELETAAIPYRLESGSLIYATQEIQDLLNCLSAVDDPTDQVSVVAALRSPAFACSDADLLEFVEAGGQFDYLVEDDAPCGHTSDALAVLRDFHERRRWMSPAALIEEFVRERRLMELALNELLWRVRWTRYRFLIDRARAFAASGETSLRAFIAWMARQRDEQARTRETVITESNEDAVRVMTIHGAKGLEFPIVLLAGLNSAQNRGSGAVLFDRESSRIEVKAGPKELSFQTAGYANLAEIDKKREEEEGVRLMYVAATRARDHLIVSLIRNSNGKRSAAARIEEFMEEAGHLWTRFEPCASEGRSSSKPSADTRTPGADTPAARKRWIKQRNAVYAALSRPGSAAATKLAKEAKDEQDIHDEPWRRGRAGTSIGRAVHAVLQVVDLTTGRGVEDIARAQAAAEGVPGRADDVERLVRRALASPLVKRALGSRRRWRETPVAGPVGDGIVYGFIDLLFEEEDGLVIVDYKTDKLGSDDEIERAMARYRLQGGAYALALSRATGANVKEVSFLFMDPNRAVTIEDLPAAMRDAEEAALALFQAGSAK